ncbi:MAG TPA: SAM-dependent methyltransferase [Anaerolineae bacterium]|nr:SAM-dependent methyltransferase [Anaerolineae bacterium]
MNIQNAYNQWSDIYDTDSNLTRDLDARITRELITEQHFDSILELGCGTGKNTVFLAQIGGWVHAMDFSQGMIQKAKQKVKAKNVRFEMADLTGRWPCDDSVHDLISCNLVLEHIKDLSHIFTEAARTLRLNGKFLINELHPFKQYTGSKARFESGIATIEVDAFVHHVSDFTKTASANGLDLVKFNEYWHEEDAGKLPRLVSFVFEKRIH